jgi:hypothetical protein
MSMIHSVIPDPACPKRARCLWCAKVAQRKRLVGQGIDREGNERITISPLQLAAQVDEASHHVDFVEHDAMEGSAVSCWKLDSS